MRLAKATLDRRTRTAQTRLCVTLTLADASALVTRFLQDPEAAALTGLQKIRTALEHVSPLDILLDSGPPATRPPRAAPVSSPRIPSPEPSALSPQPTDTPVLRAKHYRQRERAPRPPVPLKPVTPRADTYVPWREEADGRWQ